MVIARGLVTTGTVLACALAAHTAHNLRHLRSPDPASPEVRDRVAILIPARNEQSHIEATVRSALAQSGVPHLTVTVLDDGSTDDTGSIVARLAAADPRLTLISADDAPPPPGWLGKPWACARLAQHADQADTRADVLVFVDADVVLEPFAIRAVVATLRAADVGLVAPYPFQEADSWLERLVQPLVTWSWAATLPLKWAETSQRPSLSAANGQFLAIDAAAYAAIEGHVRVQGDVIEDVALMREMKRSGHRTVTVDGSQLASCRMYQGSEALVDGYAKSLWSAFNGPVGSVAVNAVLLTAFVLPAVAAVAAPTRRTRAIGRVGYAAGVASRALVARRTGERLLPDALLQPASIAAFAALNVVSWRRHRAGTNTWKGRPVTTSPREDQR
jgi:GT2 family glycosyltransferase